MWELVVPQVRVEHGEVLDLGKTVGHGGDGIIGDERAVHQRWLVSHDCQQHCLLIANESLPGDRDEAGEEAVKLDRRTYACARNQKPLSAGFSSHPRNQSMADAPGTRPSSHLSPLTGRQWFF